MKKATRLPDSLAGRIARAILKQFTIRYVDDKRNYWGMCEYKPVDLAGTIQTVIDKETP